MNTKNIYLRKDGRWEGRYPKGRESGRLQYAYVYGKTYAEAERKLKEKRRLTASDGEETFASVSAAWLEARRPELKPASITKYADILQNYLLPRLGGRDIRTISRSEVSAFRRELSASSGLAPRTVGCILSVLKGIFHYASREKDLPVADIADISVKQPQKPLRVLSLPEQQRLSAYLCKELSPCHLGILLSLYTGLRIGEICALQWGDILLEEPCVYVHKTMQRISLFHPQGRKTKVALLPPKSDSSIRKIPIPAQLLPLLRQAQQEDSVFLLTGSSLAYMEPRCLSNRFHAAAAACAIPDVHFHTLRHTFATRCMELGFDAKSLSEILGHASVSITLNRYVHPSMALKQKNMDKLSAFLTKI